MKNNTNHILFVFFTTIILLLFKILGLQATSLREQFYYSYDTKVYIESIPGEILISKDKNVKVEELEFAIKTLCINPSIDWYNSEYCTVTMDTLDFKEAISKLRNLDIVNSVYPKFVTVDDLEYSNNNIFFKPLHLGISNNIVLKFKEDVSENLKEILIRQYHLQRESTNPAFEVMKLLTRTDVIDISRKLYETGSFVFASPEIICPFSFHDRAYYPNDPYFTNQRALHNTGQWINGHSGSIDADIDLPEAWTLTMGSEDIVVAVIDEGVTSNHPDLPNTRQIRLEGSNFGAGDPDDPSPTGNANHGNACAGIIAATANNEQGIAGVAPNCKIMPIRTDNTTSTTQMANAIIFAVNNGANIISNSWGYNTTTILVPIMSAIEYAINNDVFVAFSAGNNAEHVINYNGHVYFPANLRIPGMICVGSSDRYDYQSDYSPTDTCIDIVAPSHRAFPRYYNDFYYQYTGIQGENLEMWTIDIPDNAGYNPWPSDEPSHFNVGSELPTSGINYLAYTGRFGGTSYSCPIVAGVAALLLSMRPDLTPQNLYTILTSTANKIGGYNYDVNGRCDETGYGRVNANNAVWFVCDTTFFTQTVMSHQERTKTGCDILLENDYILHNSNLKIRARNSVTITKYFYVGYNSVLDIKNF